MGEGCFGAVLCLGLSFYAMAVGRACFGIGCACRLLELFNVVACRCRLAFGVFCGLCFLRLFFFVFFGFFVWFFWCSIFVVVVSLLFFCGF